MNLGYNDSYTFTAREVSVILVAHIEKNTRGLFVQTLDQARIDVKIAYVTGGSGDHPEGPLAEITISR